MLKTKTAEPDIRQTRTPCYSGKFSLSLGKALTSSLNTYNGHLFLAQSTDSHRKLTSLMRTLHHQLCADFSFLKVKKLQFTEFRFSQRYSTPYQGRIQDFFKEGMHSSLALLQHQ